MFRRTVLTCIALFVAVAWICSGLAGTAQADDYPSKPITFVVPFSASGSPPNVLARELATRMEKKYGQPAVVENRPGAGGQIAAQYVAKQKADGYTLMMGSVATHAIRRALKDDLPIDTLTAFSPVSQFGYTPMLISANPKLGVSSIEELVAKATAKPNSITYASVGVGSAAHLTSELLQTAAGIKLIHVPYPGIGQAKLDIVSGEVNVGFSNIISMVQFIQEGTINALAVTDTKRSGILPDTPAIAEAYPEAVVELWWGLFAPVGTPGNVIAKLNAEVNEMVKDPALVGRFAKGGATLKGTTPEGLGALLRKDFEKWSKVIKQAGITK
jgi:tripartite-type tricarboxylate transporter receptor subunit TctC